MIYCACQPPSLTRFCLVFVNSLHFYLQKSMAFAFESNFGHKLCDDLGFTLQRTQTSIAIRKRPWPWEKKRGYKDGSRSFVRWRWIERRRKAESIRNQNSQTEFHRNWMFGINADCISTETFFVRSLKGGFAESF